MLDICNLFSVGLSQVFQVIECVCPFFSEVTHPVTDPLRSRVFLSVTSLPFLVCRNQVRRVLFRCKSVERLSPLDLPLPHRVSQSRGTERGIVSRFYTVIVVVEVYGTLLLKKPLMRKSVVKRVSTPGDYR